jgi:hypothetical protein
MSKTVLISFCILCLVFTSPSYAQTHIATVSKYQATTGLSISKYFASPSTSGNLIIVQLTYDNRSASVSTVTDSKGNSYSRIGTPVNWNTIDRSELWYSYNITGGGSAIMITATLTIAPTSYLQIYASEYSGIMVTSNPLDQSSFTAGSSMAVSTTPKTTLNPNELIYGASIGASGALTTGAGFTNRSSANQNIIEDKNGTSAGSYSATFSSAGGNWIAMMASFRTPIVLPVTWLNVNAKQLNNNSVRIEWATAAEISNNYFQVERSADGIEWTIVRQLKGSENSNSAIEYNAIDSSPYMPLTYYRIKQVDFDGKGTYSQVKVVHINGNADQSIRVYPNPAQNNIYAAASNSDLRLVRIFDMLGHIKDRVNIKKISDQLISIDISTLSSGVYVLQTNNKSVTFYKN